jgi:hypothetical protein
VWSTLPAALALWALLAPYTFAAPIVAGGHYEEYVTKNCGSVAACTLVFSPIPAGESLILDTISCHIFAGASPPPLIVLLAMSGNGSATYLSVPVANYAASNQRRWSTTQDVMKVYQTGNRPSVSVNMSAIASVSLFCSIAGQLP